MGSVWGWKMGSVWVSGWALCLGYELGLTLERNLAFEMGNLSDSAMENLLDWKKGHSLDAKMVLQLGSLLVSV